MPTQSQLTTIVLDTDELETLLQLTRCRMLYQTMLFNNKPAQAGIDKVFPAQDKISNLVANVRHVVERTE